MGIDLGSPGWSERVLPPAAAEARGRRGGKERKGEGRGGREERRAVAGGAPVCRALGLRGSPSANVSRRCSSSGGRGIV